MKFDENADINSEQGFTVNNFLKYGQTECCHFDETEYIS